MDLHAGTDHLADLLEQKLDVRGAGFAAKVARAGRMLPKYLRGEAAILVDALRVVEHPKLARQVDDARLKRALDDLERYLQAVNPWDRRRAIALNWLAGNAFNLLVVGAVLIAVLAWRGFL